MLVKPLTGPTFQKNPHVLAGGICNFHIIFSSRSNILNLSMTCLISSLILSQSPMSYLALSLFSFQMRGILKAQKNCYWCWNSISMRPRSRLTIGPSRPYLCMYSIFTWLFIDPNFQSEVDSRNLCIFKIDVLHSIARHLKIKE